MGRLKIKSRAREGAKRVAGARMFYGVGAYMAVVLVAAGAGLYSLGQDIDELNVQVQAATSQTESLKQQIQDIEGRKVPTSQDLSSEIEKASTSGQKVAELQNNYATIAPSDNDGLKANAEELRALLAPQVSDGISPWFPAAVTWKMVMTQEYSPTEIPVIWVAMFEDGAVGGYATANWSIKDHVFTDLQVVNTALGAKRVEATVENENKTTMDELIKKIPSDSVQPVDQGTLDDLWKARSQAQDHYEQEGR